MTSLQICTLHTGSTPASGGFVPGFSGMDGMASLRSLGGMDPGLGAIGMAPQMAQAQQSMNALTLQMMMLLLQLMLGGAGGQKASGAVPEASAASAPAEVGGTSAGGGWVKPVDNYKITSGFGPRNAPTAGASTNHKGIDLAAPLNTPVRAAKGGKVTVSKDQATGYGKWIEIQHPDGTKSRYGHLNARDVQVGAQVQAGQVIGKMGSTGTSTGSHLHFEILDSSGTQIDPAKAMKL